MTELKVYFPDGEEEYCPGWAGGVPIICDYEGCDEPDECADAGEWSTSCESWAGDDAWSRPGTMLWPPHTKTVRPWGEIDGRRYCLYHLKKVVETSGGEHAVRTLRQIEEGKRS